MTPLTPKQRERIYRRAAELIDADHWIKFACIHIGIFMMVDKLYDIDLANYAPEFFLFRPRKDYQRGAWWEQDEKEPRILALLFAAEMCRTSNQ